MATAYAAFTSLMHLTMQLHEHPYPPIQLEEKQVDSLSSQICFFQTFLEDHHCAIDHELEIRIADAAHAAEDLIETHIADRVPDFYGRFQRVIEGMDLIKKQVMEMNWNEPSQQGNNNGPARYSTPPASSQPRSAAAGEHIVVGIEDITINIVDKLTSSQYKSDRQIISISGMGGIGKTTLARKVYDHPYVKHYFDLFAWATISKDYNSHESLLEILYCLDRSESKEHLREKSEYDLGEQIYKCLFGRRYLIILDDVWDFEAWQRLRSFFPTCSGCGIVITTRESEFDSMSSHNFRMNLLDEHKSWDLFCKYVFGQGCCPVELESVGKNIANKCSGLPLSIAVIGSHLAKYSRKPEYWEYVAQNLSTVVNSEDDDRCLRILSLSYTHLPVHLKPCFLYMAIFSEDEEINVSRLIKLWVAEGFVKPINGKSLEGAAQDYLNDLIGRNLVLAYKSSRRGKIVRCKIHDLLRDFCLKEASKKNFLCSVQNLDDLRVTNNERRMVVHPSALEEASMTHDIVGTQNKEPMVINIVLEARLLLRSLIFNGEMPSLENKLLRVLAPFDVSLETSHTLLPEILHQLVNMRYFEFSINDGDEFYNLPSSIFHLWNMQSLIIRNKFTTVPPEIWKMPRLGHIMITPGVILSHPPSEESNDVIIMENLQSAELIVNFSFCEEVVKRIPNIKKLEVVYDDEYEGFDEGLRTLNNVGCLQKLESFTCSIETEHAYSALGNLTFPHSLKKVRIAELHWDDVTTKIGSLPLLQVLELHDCKGHEWELVEGQFLKLKSLELYRCYSLGYLTANNNHFPCLQRLFMYEMERLEEISSEIGDIPMLKLIHLVSCPDSAVISAKEIADEQYGLGNEVLQVTAELSPEKSSLSESLISTCNFHIKLY